MLIKVAKAVGNFLSLTGRRLAAEPTFAFSAVALDFLGLLGLQVIAGLALGQVLSWSYGVKIIALALVCNFVAGVYRTHSLTALSRILRSVFALAAATIALRSFPVPFGVPETAENLLLGFLVIWHVFVRIAGSTAARRHALLRALLPGASTIYLLSGFIGSASIGAGDGYWYSLMVADFVEQWRLGQFPAFVGQTEFAFNGTIFPHRFGPLLLHAAGLLDLATGRTLSHLALLNGSLFIAGALGALGAYCCIGAVLPGRPWTRTGLALLYVSSPAVLSLAYTGGLYMSMTTVPFIPWIALAIWRTTDRSKALPVFGTVAPLAAIWFGHVPIAFWSHAVLAVALALRWLEFWRSPLKIAKEASSIVAVFLPLTVFVFVSALTLEPEGAGATVESVMNSVRASFPGTVLPVSSGANLTSDYQLGLGILFLFCTALVCWSRHRVIGQGLLFGLACFLATLLFPIPYLTHWLWLLVPQVVVDATYLWPMQRLTVIMLSLVLTGIAAVIAGQATSSPRARRLAVCVWVAAAWSHLEAFRFVARGADTAVPSKAAAVAIAPNNASLTRYAFFRFDTVPHYYTHGYTDPLLAHRLLTPSGGEEILSNERAVAASAPDRTMTLTAKFDGVQVAVLSPNVVLSPTDRHYFSIEWHSTSPALDGVLTATSPSTNRLYWLPDSGFSATYAAENRSFGIGPLHAGGFSIWSSAATAESLDLRFSYRLPPPNGPSGRFLTINDHVYSAQSLPIKISSLTPLKATLEAPESGGLLETTRMYIDGYRARVNETEVIPVKTPNRLVGIPVPPGVSNVELTFVGSGLLRASYWISFVSWLAVIGILSVSALSKRRKSPALP